MHFTQSELRRKTGPKKKTGFHPKLATNKHFFLISWWIDEIQKAIRDWWERSWLLGGEVCVRTAHTSNVDLIFVSFQNLFSSNSNVSLTEEMVGLLNSSWAGIVQSQWHWAIRILTFFTCTLFPAAATKTLCTFESVVLCPICRHQNNVEGRCYSPLVLPYPLVTVNNLLHWTLLFGNRDLIWHATISVSRRPHSALGYVVKVSAPASVFPCTNHVPLKHIIYMYVSFVWKVLNDQLHMWVSIHVYALWLEQLLSFPGSTREEIGHYPRIGAWYFNTWGDQSKTALDKADCSVLNCCAQNNDTMLASLITLNTLIALSPVCCLFSRWNLSSPWVFFLFWKCLWQ